MRIGLQPIALPTELHSNVPDIQRRVRARGGSGTRTHDFRVMNPAIYQLIYPAMEGDRESCPLHCETNTVS